ncbi:MAG: hypothetical protein CMF50_07745 [Legionellales bacterium]|nr:hypothetical protein [Legionellales bacterium]|tara:strand:+ start:457 stop:1470 length:1014 start_codon:yes stop_codon:yes gene_type:complete
MKQTLKLSLVAFTASASLLIMPAARADDCCKQTVTTINNIYSYLTDNIGKKYLKPLVTTELSYGTETKSNSVAAKAPEWVNEDAAKTTDITSTQLITGKNSAQIVNALASIVPQADEKNLADYYPYISYASIANNMAIEPSDFNFWSFVTNPQQAKQNLKNSPMSQAQLFLQLLAGNSNAVQPLDTNALDPKNYDGEIIPQTVLKYQAGLGTLAATSSVGLNTFATQIAERKVQKDLGAKSGFSGDMSPLQLAAKKASYRLESDQIQNTINKATPKDLQVQTYILLAEINQAMFENRMQLEQLNANMAAVELQMVQGQKFGLQTTQRMGKQAQQRQQ